MLVMALIPASPSPVPSNLEGDYLTQGATQDRQQGARRRFAIWGGTAALMALPILIIRATQTAVRDPGDYGFLIILLTGVGIAYEVASRVPARSAYLAAWIIAAATALLNVWINLAVGIIGSEDNPANLIYAGVIAVAIGDALLARFQPLGMARAMIGTAAAQLLIFVIALLRASVSPARSPSSFPHFG